ncbi:tRNA 2-selenouridine(34) synthase MnmH [Aquitalea sp.]|uniref:tRNA 2-selenouridine(34) synthase MnmH n=1 Tax=Aquitalea sp. TaxID=1872623 RepID=UPI002584A2C1|nr:tRNA 2-selenouridine(34) synthase MnmH [Aquitalea sp.]
MHFKVAKLSQLGQFDEIIDVRSPAEFAEDHLPGAINCPVLDDEERIQVGTLYKQVSPFEARKLGAALVARNIAHHLQERFHDKPKSWKPLIYCWRGGQRSASMAIIFSQIGWAAHQLEGGYKSYRHQVLEDLATLPEQLQLKVICGPTGSGKSRLLDALQRTGRQVLDLEALAAHRGSVLGRLPDQPQPSQKWFDSKLRQAMQQLDTTHPVYIESESRKIGQITLPDSLFSRMHASDCLTMTVPLAERVRFLLEDYPFYLQQPERLVTQLGFLKAVHSREQLQHWQEMIERGDFASLVEELLGQHYDPLYSRSMNRHYSRLSLAEQLDLQSLTPAALDTVARHLPQ